MLNTLKRWTFEVVGWAVVAFLAFLIIFAVWGTTTAVIHYFTSSVTLMPCDTEDSDNCYWDAEQQGNGVGKSFVVLDGKVYFE